MSVLVLPGVAPNRWRGGGYTTLPEMIVSAQTGRPLWLYCLLDRMKHGS